MSRFVSLLALVLTVGLSPLHAQSSASADDQVVGTVPARIRAMPRGSARWCFPRDATRKIGGTVEATADAGNSYTATFKSVVVDGKTVKMAYDDPESATVEVQAARVDGNSMTGTWKSVDMGAKSVEASGTFTGSKR